MRSVRLGAPGGGVLGFSSNLMSQMQKQIYRASYSVEDWKRTIAIDTKYIGTTSFDIDNEDKKFVIAIGCTSTQQWLNSRAEQQMLSKVTIGGQKLDSDQFLMVERAAGNGD